MPKPVPDCDITMRTLPLAWDKQNVASSVEVQSGTIEARIYVMHDTVFLMFCSDTHSILFISFLFQSKLLFRQSNTA